MYDYISVVSADNDQTLSVQPSHMITEIGSFKEEIRKGDDGSEERVRLGSDVPEFYVTLYWSNRLAADIGTIFDFYFNASYGNGQLESFKWSHPKDGHTYIVRFDGELSRTITNPNFHGIPSCRLRILGRIAEESPSESPSLSPSASESPSESPSLSPSASESPSESPSPSPS